MRYIFYDNFVTCEDKIKFKTYNQAKVILKQSKKEYGKNLKIYNCNCCHNFHLSTLFYVSEKEKYKKDFFNWRMCDLVEL